MAKYTNTRSRNRYKNRPYPRPLTDGAVRGWKPWRPNPNPRAVRTLGPEQIAERRQARRIRSTKHLPKRAAKT